MVKVEPRQKLRRTNKQYKQESPLRERKRHTVCCVASTPYVVLLGTPPPRVPPCQGTPHQGTPHQGTPLADLAGYPPPPRWLPHGILGNVAKHYGIWVPPQVWTDKQSELLPSHRSTYAGGNNPPHNFVPPRPHPVTIFNRFSQFYPRPLQFI